MFSYRFCALRIDSEVELRRLATWVGPGGSADIEIIRQRLSPSPDRPIVVSPFSCIDSNGNCRSHFPKVVNWEARAATVAFEALDGADPAQVASLIYQRALVHVLHQRGLVPFHASAISVNGKAILFSGRSGAGKSTLATALAGAGYVQLADDRCVIDPFAAGGPVILPGADSVQPCLAVSSNNNNNPVPLAAICYLDTGDDVTLEPIADKQVVAGSLRLNIFLEKMNAILERRRAPHPGSRTLLTGVPQFRLRRPFVPGANILSVLPCLQHAFAA